jgi:alkylhydroperoxidase family enzyme
MRACDDRHDGGFGSAGAAARLLRAALRLFRPGRTEGVVPASIKEREALAVRWAELAATEHMLVDGVFLAEVKEHFDTPEVIELGMMIGQYIGFGRMLVQLGSTSSAESGPFPR